MNSKPIPILDLQEQYRIIHDEIHAAINRVLSSQQFILGNEVENLENKLADYCHSKYAFGVSSGTDALLVALMAIGIEPGDEVITSPYSFFATAGSIARLGAKPVFVDIDINSFNLQANQIEKAITARTKAIMPVHLAGQTADMDPINDIASRYGLYVIEDACQAIGADYKGKRAGSLGHLGCFSFFPSKNLGGYGDSGLISTNDPDLADKVFLLRNHGQRRKYRNEVIGGNFRMDALQAAILQAKLPFLEGWIDNRRSHANRYRELFVQAGILFLGNDSDNRNRIILPSESDFGRHTYHLFIIRTENRDNLMAHLRVNNIGCEIYYPLPLHLQECFEYLHHKLGDFPFSEQAATESLAIPIYPELSDEMLVRVVTIIANFFKQSQ